MANPNIILSAQRPRVDRQANEAYGMQMQNQRAQLANNTLAYTAQADALQRQTAMRNALAQAGTDPKAIQNVYYQYGDPATALSIGKDMRMEAKDTREAAADARTGYKDTADALKSMALAFENPETYPQIRQNFVQAFPQAEQYLPPEYTPGVGQQLLAQFETPAERNAS